MHNLRQVLDDILLDPNIKNHYDEIKSIRNEFNHNIRLIEEPPQWPNNYNCFEFALSMHDNDKYIGRNGLKYKLQHKGDNGIFIDSSFIQYLINNHILLENKKGSVIIYFNKNKITHGGILKNKLVLSKWGIGNLYQHEVFEVPEKYGMEHKQFKKIDKDTVLKKFNNFSAEHKD